MLAIGRLEGEEEVIRGEVEVELVEDNLLKEFGEKREIRDRVVGFEVLWVKVVFFEERMNDGGLENARNGASQYGRVDDVSDEGQELGKAVRVDQVGRGRVHRF